MRVVATIRQGDVARCGGLRIEMIRDGRHPILMIHDPVSGATVEVSPASRRAVAVVARTTADHPLTIESDRGEPSGEPLIRTGQGAYIREVWPEDLDAQQPETALRAGESRGCVRRPRATDGNLSPVVSTGPEATP
jgi:hypothetical protein